MNDLSKEDKLRKIIEKVNTDKITVYQLAKNTKLNQSGLGRLIKGEVENPHEATIDKLYDFLYSKNIVVKKHHQTITIDGHDLKIKSVEQAIYENIDLFLREKGVLKLVVKNEVNEMFKKIVEENNLQIKYEVKS